MIAVFQGLGLSLVMLLLAGSRVLAQDHLTIVAEDNWYPYSAERDGAAEGFAVDLVRAAYRAAGHDVRFVTMPYARCLEEVRAGRELGCFDTTHEPENESRFLFHQVPLFSATIVIVGPADSPAQELTPADLRGQKVAITNGYTYGEPFQSDATINKDVVVSDLSVLRVVALKRATYGLVYDRVMASIISEHAAELAGKVKIVGMLSQQDLFISFSKARPEASEAMAALDRGLTLIKADGTYQAIEQRWVDRFAVAGGM